MQYFEIERKMAILCVRNGKWRSFLKILILIGLFSKFTVRPLGDGFSNISMIHIAVMAMVYDKFVESHCHPDKRLTVVAAACVG
jgi:hypothetical protein